MKKITFAFMALLLMATSAFALKDELGKSGDPDKAITNRPMKRTYNLQAIQTAFDDANATKSETVHDWNHHKDNLYKLRLREWMHTTVVLPKNEHIEDFSLGDEGNFVFLPQLREGNVHKFIIFGKLPGADTSLTVHGESGNIYPFYLRIDDHNSKYLPDILVRVHDPTIFEFKSNRAEKLAARKSDPFAPVGQDEETPDYLHKVAKTAPSEWNFDYQLDPPNSDIAPRQVFDDGIMTYFRFGTDGNMDRVPSLPVVFRVMDGHDAIVNTRVEGEFLVAETINANWTIRSGDKWVCARQTPGK